MKKKIAKFKIEYYKMLREYEKFFVLILYNNVVMRNEKVYNKSINIAEQGFWA